MCSVRTFTMNLKNTTKPGIEISAVIPREAGDVTLLVCRRHRKQTVVLHRNSPSLFPLLSFGDTFISRVLLTTWHHRYMSFSRANLTLTKGLSPKRQFLNLFTVVNLHYLPGVYNLNERLCVRKNVNSCFPQTRQTLAARAKGFDEEFIPSL